MADKYYQRSHVIEAFRFGFDPMPEWFIDGMLANRIVTHIIKKEQDRTRLIGYVKTTQAPVEILDGDYVCKIGAGLHIYKPNQFNVLFGKVESGRLL